MLKKNEYAKLVRRPYPPLYASIVMHGFANKKYHAPFADELVCMPNIIKSDECWYFSKKDMRRVGEIFTRYWTKSPSVLSRVIKVLLERERNVLHAASRDLPAFIHATEEYCPAFSIVFADSLAATLLQKNLQEKISIAETSQLLNVLNIPLRDNFYKREELELLQTKNIAAHVKKYEWLLSRYGQARPYTVQEAVAKKAQMNTKEILSCYYSEKTEVKKAIARAKKILGKEKSAIVDFVQFIVYYRTQRTDIYNRALYQFIPKAKIIAKKLGLTYQELLHCTRDEVLGTLPSVKAIHLREKSHAVISDETGVRCVSGREAGQIRTMFKEEYGSIRKCSGTVASKGSAKGIVKLLFHGGDCTKVKRGDILVASMTTPEMIPAMKRASAFVTDEGGITCHAAIISREMKKPCVIGTKIATKIFKDGDRVAVDASKGIVKKL